ncbi:MAG: PEP-CTERM sorting domain-containing protein [bacterium]|nr:PEP-CTERM sorting domain-containing protein [bacterium]
MRRRFFLPLALTTLLATLILASPAIAIDPVFDRLLDDTTLIPGSANTFASVRFPVVEDSQLVFTSNVGERGFYAVDSTTGNVTTLVDESTLVPGGAALFDSFGASDIDGGHLIFTGGNPSVPGATGLYRVPLGGGPIEVIANTTTIAPGYGQPFTAITDASAGSGTIAFKAQVDTGQLAGIYRYENGLLEVVADRNTTVPGQGVPFRSFSTVHVGTEGNIAFLGGVSPLQEGLFSDRTGALESVALEDVVLDPVNGTTLSGFDFGSAIGGDDVAFRAAHSGGSFGAVYVDEAAGLRRIASRGDLVPGGGDSFLWFTGDVAHFGDKTVFRARTLSGEEGIYVDVAGEVHTLLAFGSLLDGAEVDFANFYSDGLHGDELALGVDFIGGTNALYLVTIPEPGTAILLGLGLGGLCAFRRRAGSPA